MDIVQYVTPVSPVNSNPNNWSIS